MNNTKDDFLVNNIFLLEKFYVHKSKNLKVKPMFCAFYKEFRLLLIQECSFKVMKKKSAINLLSFIEEYDLQEKP